MAGIESTNKNISNNIQVECAWHPRTFGTELIMKSGDTHDGVSHSICVKCAVRNILKDDFIELLKSPFTSFEMLEIAYMYIKEGGDTEWINRNAN